MPVQRPRRVTLLIAALLLAAFVLDLLVVPAELLVLLYVVPLLVAAQRLTPTAVAVLSVIALLLFTVNVLVRDSTLWLVVLHFLSLLAVAYLAYLLSARIQEVERARANLQNFLGMVAHDLRGPLTSVLGYAQLAVRPGTVPERRQHALTAIESEARRMNRLVADLVDAARVGAGRFQVQPQPIDLVALARRVVEAQQAVSPQHCVDLEAPDRLEGEWDPDRLVQVLTNLVGNATKYSPGGGKITVRLRRADGQAVFSVSDPGIGIRREDLPLLFQPFSRLYAERGTHGAGLGLYIAHGIAQAHGGRIWATSEGVGKGSTFTFTLPLERQAHAVGSTPS